MLRQTLATVGYPMDAEDMNAYLAYLEERQYVRTEDRKQFNIVLVSITANGLDVLDGRIEDRGVGVKFE